MIRKIYFLCVRTKLFGNQRAVVLGNFSPALPPSPIKNWGFPFNQVWVQRLARVNDGSGILFGFFLPKRYSGQRVKTPK
ncbi:hypothetical protein DHW03_12475 [Pedobacter yonginense]|uniref:Uncharacterized protein n=1 Tax=Pedobacter yonginense TaxID=651869 RepID=A0A317EJ17_9SPHI|nr:hypothetical protein [Pedobacter yonginense]PWS26841.1 hypothetical protein DHW03_12475 [Pedobacter yonginense]